MKEFLELLKDPRKQGLCVLKTLVLLCSLLRITSMFLIGVITGGVLIHMIRHMPFLAAFGILDLILGAWFLYLTREASWPGWVGLSLMGLGLLLPLSVALVPLDFLSLLFVLLVTIVFLIFFSCDIVRYQMFARYSEDKSLP